MDKQATQIVNARISLREVRVLDEYAEHLDMNRAEYIRLCMRVIRRMQVNKSPDKFFEWIESFNKDTKYDTSEIPKRYKE